MKKKKTTKKIILEIVEWFLIAVCLLFVVFVAIFASKNPTDKRNSSSVFGYETRLVLTGSMEQDKDFYKGKGYKIKAIKQHSLVFLDSAPVDNEQIADGKYTDKFVKYLNKIKVNDIITFVDPSLGPSTPITHRVIDIKEESDGTLSYVTHGDANDEGVNEYIPAVNIEGRVIGKSHVLGLAYYEGFFKSKVPAALAIIIPCAIIMTYEIFKVVSIVKEDKKAKAALGDTSKLSKEDEMRVLEERLAELKKSSKKEEDEK